MPSLYPFTCDGCGRSGTEDDGCADGETCPDEECGGTVRRTTEETY